MILRGVRFILGGGFLIAGALLALLFEAHYWRWRDCFNELGRCFDPDTGQVFLEQSGMVWGGLSVISILTGVFVLWNLRRR